MTIPQEIKDTIQNLKKAGFKAYPVGGCVRDILMDKTPKDWDITTDATPEQIQATFPDSFYENDFGTVTVKNEIGDDSLKNIQITPFRIEGKYEDGRHPSDVKFVTSLEDDLSRRDFTVNAMALDIEDNSFKVIDLYGGQEDIKSKLVRAVGDADQRFSEDALRLMRAVRFATTLNFEIEEKTKEAISSRAESLNKISVERIRDEFIKIIESERAYYGILSLNETGLLKYIVPELEEGIGVGQNLHHIYTVWEHNLLSLKYASEKGYSLEVRLASLFHDIGKPRTKRGDGEKSTFYGHEVVGGRMVEKIMKRLKFSGYTSDKVTKLVRYHMFYYNVGEVTESSVRRLIANIGLENVEDIIRTREADRIGSGRPKAVPYKLRHLKYIVDKVSTDPVSVKMLKVDGNEIMKKLDILPGPKVGTILNLLLAEVIEDPSKNDKEYLIERSRDLETKSQEELIEALNLIKKANEKEDLERKKKHYV